MPKHRPTRNPEGSSPRIQTIQRVLFSPVFTSPEGGKYYPGSSRDSAFLVRIAHFLPEMLRVKISNYPRGTANLSNSLRVFPTEPFGNDGELNGCAKMTTITEGRAVESSRRGGHASTPSWRAADTPTPRQSRSPRSSRHGVGVTRFIVKATACVTTLPQPL